MIKLKAYAHLIRPIIGNEPITNEHYEAIRKVSDTVHYLARVYDGKADMDGDGSASAQWDDIIKFNHLSENSLRVILNNYPFIKKISSY